MRFNDGRLSEFGFRFSAVAVAKLLSRLPANALWSGALFCS